MEKSQSSRSLRSLQKKLQAIECGSEMSPAPSAAPTFDLDLSGVNFLENAGAERHPPWQQQPQQRTMEQEIRGILPERYSPPLEEEWRRQRHASDAEGRTSQSHFAAASLAASRQADFGGGLTMPTSASKKKPGMRSYASTPDCKNLLDSVPTTNADETGTRRRLLGKPRRVLRTSDQAATPAPEMERKAENLSSVKLHESLAFDTNSHHILDVIDESRDVPSAVNVSIDVSREGKLAPMDALIDSVTECSDPLSSVDIADNDLNASFRESMSLSSNGDENLDVDESDPASLRHRPLQPSVPDRRMAPLKELNFNRPEAILTPPKPPPMEQGFQRKRIEVEEKRAKTPMQRDHVPAASYRPPATPMNSYPLEPPHQSFHRAQNYPPLHQQPIFTPAQPPPPQAAYFGRQPKLIRIQGVDYRLVRQIGSGGSSKVHQALDTNKRQLVAIKTVDLDEVDQDMVESFQNEIGLLAKLQHSNRVVKLLNWEMCRASNSLSIVMECGDCDLAVIFNDRASRNDVSPNLIRFYWEEMLSCIAVTHKEGIVHSDLKPANFLLVNGTLKLIDFGIANAIQSDKTSVTRDSQIGTLNYMSPEAILDTQPQTEESEKPRIKIGTKSDVWSLGCILYSMVYNKTPFHHLNNLTKLQAIINPRCVIKFPDAGDPHMVDVMKSCLNRDPKSRPTVDELLRHPYLRRA